jgi:DNA polymerase-3 subunit epsilon
LERIAVIDFETTGITPSSHCRATEIAVVILERGQIVDRYQSLMNAGVRVPGFIEQLTGISNAMLRSAPPAERVMNEVNEFVGTTPLMAHNAAFDQKFWDFELADAEMAANLTAHLAQELRRTHGLRELSHDFLCTLQKVPAAKINEHLKKHRGF